MLENLLNDPGFFLAGLDNDHLLFRRMDRDAFARSIFADQRIKALDEVTIRAPIEPLLSGARALALPSRRLGYIFHVAHCGSTLLARALERCADILVLRDPGVLRQLGVLAASTAPSPPPREWETIANLAAALLGKRFARTAPVIVKANVPVNFMIDWAMMRHRETPAIMLYLTFEDYLLAVLRTDDHRRWVERVGGELYPALAPFLHPADMLDTAKVAAALWLAQMQRFASALTSFPSARSLDAQAFFAMPGKTLSSAFALFGLAVTEAEVAAIVDGPLFSSYAKRADRPYSERERLTLRDAARDRLTNEVQETRKWLETALEQHPLPTVLPKPLFGDGPSLL